MRAFRKHSSYLLSLTSSTGRISFDEHSEENTIWYCKLFTRDHWQQQFLKLSLYPFLIPVGDTFWWSICRRRRKTNSISFFAKLTIGGVFEFLAHVGGDMICPFLNANTRIVHPFSLQPPELTGIYLCFQLLSVADSAKIGKPCRISTVK